MFGQGSARIRTTEFFGVVLPGFYLVAQLGTLILAFPRVAGAVKWPSAPEIIARLWAPGLVILLFVCYIVGSVFRSRKMRDTDGYCYDLFHEHRSGKKHSSETTREFPYVESLRDAKSAIVEAIGDSDWKRFNGSNTQEWLLKNVPPYGLGEDKHDDTGPWEGAHKPGWGEGECMFGLWKARLCNENSAGFEFGQSAEARTRFFAGMMWAARDSVTLMFWAAVVLFACEAPPGQCVLVVVAVALGILGLSLDHPFKPKKPVRNASARTTQQSPPEPPAITRTPRSWRVMVWTRLVIEAVGTVGLYSLAVCDGAWVPSACARPRAASAASLFAIFLTIVSVYLFVFLGKRLRNVRNGELRAVYLNYCALVLYPPGAK